MAEVVRSQASSVLRVVADLSPSAQQRSAALTVPLDWFRWLPASAVSLFTPAPGDVANTTAAAPVTIHRDGGEQLSAIASVPSSARCGPAGGSSPGGGRSRPVGGSPSSPLC